MHSPVWLMNGMAGVIPSEGLNSKARRNPFNLSYYADIKKRRAKDARLYEFPSFISHAKEAMPGWRPLSNWIVIVYYLVRKWA
jgi:hypothetical protein